MLYAFLLGYLPSIFLTFSAKPIDFYLQDCLCGFGSKTKAPILHRYNHTCLPV
mgnify:CR=1 FL=1